MTEPLAPAPASPTAPAHPAPRTPRTARHADALAEGGAEDLPPDACPHPEFDAEPVHSWRLAARPASVRQMRHAAQRWLHGHGVAATVREESALLVSELATNAVDHAGGRYLLCRLALPARDVVSLEVHDEAPPGRLPRRRQARLTAEHGRGLFLVDALADAWGVGPSAETGGHLVWAHLPRRTV